MAPARPLGFGGAAAGRQFVLEDRVGRGGYGEVWRARWHGVSGMQGVCAVKLLHRRYAVESEAAKRLLDEARLLGLVRHPNIPVVFDVVYLNGQIALVSEFVDGVDLQGFLGREPRIPLRPALMVLARVADALEAAWSARAGPDGAPLHLIHRDVKPSNIRLGQHGQVKLLDFGIARSDSVARAARTEASQVIGSLRYLAPERLRQEDATPAVDTYALGCVLFEVLAGYSLFNADDRRPVALSNQRAVFTAETQARIQALEAPEPVLDLLRRLLAFSPGDRPHVLGLGATFDALADETPGPTLSRWVRTLHWERITAELPAVTRTRPQTPPQHASAGEVTAATRDLAASTPPVAPAPSPVIAHPPSTRWVVVAALAAALTTVVAAWGWLVVGR